MLSPTSLKKLNHCLKCKRLRSYCKKVATVKKKATLSETYWGKPISGFGDSSAQLFIVGLAPAAHGANRTGRVFTGDRSGEWLYRELFQTGFANQPESFALSDGLKLKNSYVTCIVKCAPPQNKPEPLETTNCLSYFEEELYHFLQLEHSHKVILALGAFAWENIKKSLVKVHFQLKESHIAQEALETQQQLIKKFPKFKHGLHFKFTDKLSLLSSIHPSQQNTFTGKLTREMFKQVFTKAQKCIAGP